MLNNPEIDHLICCVPLLAPIDEAHVEAVEGGPLSASWSGRTLKAEECKSNRLGDLAAMAAGSAGLTVLQFIALKFLTAGEQLQLIYPLMLDRPY